MTDGKGRINHSFSSGPSHPKFVPLSRKKDTTGEMYIISLNLGDVICYYRVASSPINVKVK